MTQFHLFVERDLKKALEPYFIEVRVVRSKEDLPTSPHIVGDVKVDRVRINQQQSGIAVYLLAEMTWSFALRPSEADNYVFSFASTGSSTPTYPKFEVALGQMVEASLTDMLHSWTESDGIETLRRLKPSDTLPNPKPQPKESDKRNHV